MKDLLVGPAGMWKHFFWAGRMARSLRDGNLIPLYSRFVCFYPFLLLGMESKLSFQKGMTRINCPAQSEVCQGYSRDLLQQTYKNRL